MDNRKNIEKNIEILEKLKEEGVTLDLKICPQCKSPIIFRMDIVASYAPLSPARYVCKKCGWVGRIVIEMTNRRIDELDEEMLEDIINLMKSYKNL